MGGCPRTIGPGVRLGARPRASEGPGAWGQSRGRPRERGCLAGSRPLGGGHWGHGAGWCGRGGARGGRGARGRRQRRGRGAGVPAGALTVGFPGQLLHNFRLQLAVGFPHPRRPRPPRPGPDPVGAPSGSGWAGAGRAGGAGGPGRGRAFVCAGPAGPGHGGTVRQARAVRPPPSPGAAARSCAGLGADAAALSPRSSLVTELRGTCSLLRFALAAAPALPASRPHRRAGGGPGAATQRPAPPPAPHPPARPGLRRRIGGPGERRAGPAEGRPPTPGFIGPRAGRARSPPTPVTSLAAIHGAPAPAPNPTQGGAGPGRARKI